MIAAQLTWITAVRSARSPSRSPGHAAVSLGVRPASKTTVVTGGPAGNLHGESACRGAGRQACCWVQHTLTGSTESLVSVRPAQCLCHWRASPTCTQPPTTPARTVCTRGLRAPPSCSSGVANNADTKLLAFTWPNVKNYGTRCPQHRNNQVLSKVGCGENSMAGGLGAHCTGREKCGIGRDVRKAKGGAQSGGTGQASG
jgi:hypothetical protein